LPGALTQIPGVQLTWPGEKAPSFVLLFVFLISPGNSKGQ